MKIYTLVKLDPNNVNFYTLDNADVVKKHSNYYIRENGKDVKLIRFYETPFEDLHGDKLCEGDVVTYRNAQHVILRKSGKAFYLDALTDTEGKACSGKYTVLTKDVANGCLFVKSIDGKFGTLSEREATDLSNNAMPITTLIAKLSERDFQAAF